MKIISCHVRGKPPLSSNGKLHVSQLKTYIPSIKYYTIIYTGAILFIVISWNCSLRFTSWGLGLLSKPHDITYFSYILLKMLNKTRERDVD